MIKFCFHYYLIWSRPSVKLFIFYLINWFGMGSYEMGFCGTQKWVWWWRWFGVGITHDLTKKVQVILINRRVLRDCVVYYKGRKICDFSASVCYVWGKETTSFCIWGEGDEGEWVFMHEKARGPLETCLILNEMLKFIPYW